MHGSADDNKSSSGLIYRHVHLYRLAMWLLYRRERDRERDRVLAAIAPGSSVVDLCCGDCRIAPALLARNCTYLGLDINVGFLERARRRGLDVRYWAGEPHEIPEADVICMLSSLYQFIPDEANMVGTMVSRARKRAIITEPVRNWATSSFPLLRTIAESLTRVNGRSFPERLSEQNMIALAELAKRNGASATLAGLGRDVVLIFDTESARHAACPSG